MTITFLFSRFIETRIFFSEGVVENLISVQRNTMRRMMWPKLTLAPEIDLAVTSNDTFWPKGGGVYKIRISYAPDTELAHDKVNRSFGSWHGLVNKIISQEPKAADTWDFRRTLKMLKSSYSKNPISSFENVTYSAKTAWGGIQPPVPCAGEG